MEPRTADITLADGDEEAISSTEFTFAISHREGDAYLRGNDDNDGLPSHLCGSLIISPTPFTEAKPPENICNGPSKTISGPKRKRSIRFTTTFQVIPAKSTIPSTSGTSTKSVTESRSLKVLTINPQQNPSGHSMLCEMITTFWTSPSTPEQRGKISDPCICPKRSYDAYISKDNRPQNQFRRGFCSFGDLLDANKACPPIPWARRIELAATVASNFLQLQGSPWLSSEINSGDLYFAVGSSSIPIAERPSFMGSKIGSSSGKRSTSKLPPYVCNTGLYSLGILLIEIYHSERFNTSPRSTFLDDLNTAERYTTQIQMTSLNYASVVRHCLGGDLQAPNADLSSRDYKHHVYSKVVAPLRSDLENLRL